MHEYSAALILRRGYELACRFPDCPTGTKRALEAAAQRAEAEQRESVSESTWKGEPHFSDDKDLCQKK